MKRRLIARTFLLLLSGAGCHAMDKARNSLHNTARSVLTSSYNDPEAENKMARAEQLFNEEKYAEAGDLFHDLAENEKNPMALVEKARYMYGESLRLRGKYVKAVAAYNKMLTDFPAGAYREQGASRMYAIAYEWLEGDVLGDIEAEREGKGTSWWAKKSTWPNVMDSKRPFLDTEGEALKTLDHVHTHDIVGPNADKALFWAGYVNFYRGRFEDADHYFSQLVEMHKDSKLRQTALELAIIAKNNATGGAVYDQTKSAEALKLISHAEATDPLYARDPEKSAWLTRQKMAVRMQLAQKDFEIAEYYRRTKHPQAAYFHYEIVCRRYPGTRYSDLAKKRLSELEELRKKLDAERELRGGLPSDDSFLSRMEREWDRLMGNPIDPDEHPPADPTKTSEPSALPAAPRTLPIDTSR